MDDDLRREGQLLKSALVLAAALVAAQAPGVLMPAAQTAAVLADADDPAVWINPRNPAASIIVGTNKVAAPAGALVAFALDGTRKQTIAGLDRPNNVDVEYGIGLGATRVDIAVVTERLQHRLRVFAFTGPARAPLVEVSAGGGIPVLAGETGEAAEPMGIALYKRPRDGAIFAIVAPKTGAHNNYLWQYLLEDDGRGRVKGTLVRRLGVFSGVEHSADGANEIEAVAVDDALGYVYYSDEDYGIHKWRADPQGADSDRELAVFGQTGFKGDREGIGIYTRRDGTGFIVASDQLPGGTVFHVFPREGAAGRPHMHEEVAAIPTTADSTDGLDVVSTPLGPRFPMGLLVAMNSSGRDFFLYRWQDVAAAIERVRRSSSTLD